MPHGGKGTCRQPFQITAVSLVAAGYGRRWLRWRRRRWRFGISKVNHSIRHCKQYVTHRPKGNGGGETHTHTHALAYLPQSIRLCIIYSSSSVLHLNTHVVFYASGLFTYIQLPYIIYLYSVLSNTFISHCRDTAPPRYVYYFVG